MGADEPGWERRAYGVHRDDENACVYLWLKGWAQTYRNRQAGAHIARSPEERAYWDAHAPVVEHLLRTCETTLLSPPGDQGTIYAFACAGPSWLLHFVAVKRSALALGFGAEMVRDLLGDRLTEPQLVTHDLPVMMPTDRQRRAAERDGRKPLEPPCGIGMPDCWERLDARGDFWGPWRSMLGVRRVA